MTIEVPSIAVYENPNNYPHKALFLIGSVELKSCTGDKEPALYYSGKLYKMRKIGDKDLPMIPEYATTIINVPSKDIKPLK